jgi:L-asparaginase
MHDTDSRTNDSRPVLVLTTGGTIDKQYFDATSQYQISDSFVPRLLGLARVTHPFVCRELLHKDSLDLTDADRALIVEHVRTADFARVVITHGTDTMTKTAQALLGIRDKIIVLTGALAPARFNETDAPFNLGMAFAAVQVAPPGVYIAMNGTVFRGDRVVKDSALQRFIGRSE